MRTLGGADEASQEAAARRENDAKGSLTVSTLRAIVERAVVETNGYVARASRSALALGLCFTCILIVLLITLERRVTRTGPAATLPGVALGIANDVCQMLSTCLALSAIHPIERHRSLAVAAHLVTFPIAVGMVAMRGLALARMAAQGSFRADSPATQWAQAVPVAVIAAAFAVTGTSNLRVLLERARRSVGDIIAAVWRHVACIYLGVGTSVLLYECILVPAIYGPQSAAVLMAQAVRVIIDFVLCVTTAHPNTPRATHAAALRLGAQSRGNELAPLAVLLGYGAGRKELGAMAPGRRWESPADVADEYYAQAKAAPGSVELTDAVLGGLSALFARNPAPQEEPTTERRGSQSLWPWLDGVGHTLLLGRGDGRGHRSAGRGGGRLMKVAQVLPHASAGASSASSIRSTLKSRLPCSVNALMADIFRQQFRSEDGPAVDNSLGAMDAYVIYSPTDSGPARARALAAYATAFEQAHGRRPRVWLHELSTDPARGPLERIRYLVPCMALAPRALVLWGPTLTDHLWPVMELYAWSVLGGPSPEVLPAAGTAAEAEATVSAVDAFHVMYAICGDEQQSECFQRAIRTGGAACFNKAVHDCLPGVRAATSGVEDDQALVALAEQAVDCMHAE